MSSDHRRRQIDKGSVGRSRERPPDLTRECRPAGTERQISKAQQSIDNSNAKIDSLLKFQKQGARHPAPGAPTRSLAERRSAELRRLRRLRRVQTIADMRAPRLWFEMFDHAARDLGADDYIDTLLERFAGLDVDILRALAADRFPPLPPPRLVEDGQ